MSGCLSCGFAAEPELEFCPRCGAALRDPLLGALLSDRYRILERIGVGGMGAVYRAQHTALKRDVAVKVLLPDFGGKDEFIRRFEREAESASRLAHPNIIAVTDFGRTGDGLLFLVMEYLDGQSLTSLIRQGPMPLSRALSLTRQMLNALGHAHAAGVVHRDLKPDNIMLVERHGQNDVVKILDFGIAKVTDVGTSGGREALTQAGMIFGTPEYLSPEQALGDTVDARADLYATGVILFEMLVARRPFESEDKVRIISMHLSHAPPRLAQVNPMVEIPPAVEEVVMQALEKERENRFASASAFLSALDEVESELGRPPIVVTPSPAGITPPPAAASTPSVLRRPRPSHLPLSASTPAPTPPPEASSDGGASRFGSPAPVSPSARRPTLRRFPRLAAVVAISLALTAGTWVLFRGSSSRTKTVATGRLSAPVPPPAELAPRFRAIEGLLGAGEPVKARVALEQILAENPKSGRAHYLLGRLAFADGRHNEALDDYRDAMALDAGFRSDSILLDHLGVALVEPKVADAALELAISRVGRPAAHLLERVANGSGELRRRQRAATALAELGEERRVDTVSLHMAELKKAVACEEKKPLVIALGKADDLRALPTLKAQRSRGGIEGLFGGEPNNACMKTELADAITRLEAKLPPEKRPPPRASNRRGGGSHQSLFRGR